ncbi:MAG: riboflavin synthase [Pseudomonadota bacterium]
MFTGLIQTVGAVTALRDAGGDKRITIAAPGLDFAALGEGDSIAVNGVCLTALALARPHFAADVSGETLACSTIGQLRVGSRVNLETALTLQRALGGHLVSGHVDGVGTVQSRSSDARSERLHIAAPAELAKYIAAKGSISVEGVSLTVNAVEGNVFDINLIPHTLQATTLQDLRAGSRVNLEVDIIARYLERLVLGARSGGGLDEAFLAHHGFITGK